MLALRGLTRCHPTPHGRRYVFRNLSFEFPVGLSVGVLGRNGAGKSTLLRLLGGIDAPNEGRVESDERLSWPVGLSGSFQGSLTARDNVRFVCRLQGADGAEMRERVRFVERFADLGDYFDLPMKTLSSGMRARVGFGLSMAFDFDYYLIDEVLSVGDAQFKHKCRAVFRDRMDRAKMILVSHSAADVREFCEAVVHLDAGRATLYADVEAGLAAYRGAAVPR